ncbi:6121_t:CDS:1 [Diversispora eburnea]|uniref:6121_t:CDS:1 n=1 Tax=Diversispora eburnea TaxID=1213867 RepID=A0A9N9C2I4_9GLOM|nr:6121_t:CDS:1 [Diversispora eburnea]
MRIKKELQLILNDPNVKDLFYGREEVERKASKEVSIYDNQKLYIIVNRIPTEPLNIVGEFPIVYIRWGSFTDFVPTSHPKSPFPREVIKKFDSILDTHIGLDFRLQFSNLTAIGLDWKIILGCYEERPSIVFYVIRKGVIPLGDKLLPQTIAGIETDVREGYYSPTGKDSEYCRRYMSTVSSGCSIGNIGTTRAGTLGAFVKKESVEKIFFLTNHHVIQDGSKNRCLVSQPAYIDYVGKFKSDIEKEKELLKKSQHVDYDKEGTEVARAEIKRLENILKDARKKDTMLGSFFNGIRDNYEIDGKNYGVDAAIASLELLKNGNFRNINPKCFCIPESTFKQSSFEPIRPSGNIINSNLVNVSEPILKIGRETGLTVGYIKETPLSSNFLTNYHVFFQQERIFGRVLMEAIKNQNKTIFPSKWLDRQIIVRSKDSPFMEKGDSGCVWFDQSGAFIALGHGTLDTSSGTYAIGSPIHAVTKALDISIFVG